MKGRDRPLESARTASRTLSLLATCVLLAIALIALSQTALLGPVRGVLESVVMPVQRAFSNATSGLTSWVDTANNWHTLDAQNADLRQTIARLQTENTRLRSLESENETLRKILGFKQENPDLQSLPASVVGRDPSNLSRILVLDRGTDDGVREGMAVTSPGGFLLGVVRKVTAKQATVLLIDDIDSTIPAVVDRSHVDCNVQGQAQHGGRILVRHIPQGADVARGDFIKTSGLGGTLPRGLLLGQIYEVHQKDIDQEQEALGYPLAIPESIDQVLVILGVGAAGGAPRPEVPGTPNPNLTPTPGLPAPLYPVPPTRTGVPTQTPEPTVTAPRPPTVLVTRTPVRKKP